MNFASDNITGAAPEIINALVAANKGTQLGYGNDELTHAVRNRVCEIFETEAEVFLVATGTAANALALSVMTPPHGAILCHWASHVYEDECGAPELFSGGARLIPVEGAQGKIDTKYLAKKASYGKGDVHMLQPSAATVTQVTEMGTIYSLDELGAIAEVCRDHDLAMHMDGARFANALVKLDCTPAAMSWKAGVDILSFGATKNGALGVEAVVIFNPELAKTFAFKRKRAGHLLSKMRLLSAQMAAYLDNDLWLTNARHANEMASELHAGLLKIPGIEFPYSVDANMLFPLFSTELTNALFTDGFKFYNNRWEPGICRLVTAFNTKEEDVNSFIKAAGRHIVNAA